MKGGYSTALWTDGLYPWNGYSTNSSTASLLSSTGRNPVPEGPSQGYIQPLVSLQTATKSTNQKDHNLWQIHHHYQAEFTNTAAWAIFQSLPHWPSAALAMEKQKAPCPITTSLCHPDSPENKRTRDQPRTRAHLFTSEITKILTNE